jgi:hypothetical protein
MMDSAVLKAPRRELHRLYPGLPAVILFPGRETSDLAVLTWLIDLPLQMIVVVEAAGGLVARPLSDYAAGEIASDLVGIELPPPEIWLVAVFDELSAHQASAALALLKTHQPELAVSRFSSLKDPQLVMTLLRHAASQYYQAASRNAEILRSTSALRQRFERMVRIPPEVSELLENLRINGVRQGFSSEHLQALPGIETNGAAEIELNQQELRQPLPLWMRGLAGLDLHVAHVHPAEGVLRLRLEARDAAEVVAEWEVPLARLSSGWLRFRLDAPCSFTHRSAQLRLRTEGAPAGAIALSLRPTGPFFEYACSVGAQSPLSRKMLAVRSWIGLPGVPTETLPSIARQRSPLPARSIAAAVLKRPLMPQTFAALPNGHIRIHAVTGPRGALLVQGASFNVSAIDSTVSIGCRVRLMNRQSQAWVRSRLVIAAPGATLEDVECGDTLAQSEWASLRDPQREVELTAPLGTSRADLAVYVVVAYDPETPTKAGAMVVFYDFFADSEASSADFLFPVTSLVPAVAQGASLSKTGG